MKLEEFIEHIKLNKHLYYEEEFERIFGFLEELKVYKKAFELICKDYEDMHFDEPRGMHIKCPDYCPHKHECDDKGFCLFEGEAIPNYYLKKAEG